MSTRELVIDLHEALYAEIQAYAERLDLTPEEAIVRLLEEKWHERLAAMGYAGSEDHGW